MLTILVWGLLLEIIVLSHLYLTSQTQRFEYVYTLFLFSLTLISTLVIIIRLLRRAGRLGLKIQP